MNFKVYLISSMLLFSVSAFAQTPLPYFTGFDNSTQQAGWQLFRKGSNSSTGWSYSSFNCYSAPKSLAHYYPVEGTVVTDDWYVSPAFDFSPGGRIDSIRHNFSGFGSPVNGDSIGIYLLNGSPDPGLATTKTLLIDYTVNYVPDNIWYLDTNITIPAKAGLSYIAFKYKTTDNWLDLLFDNMRISVIGSSGINSVDFGKIDLSIYPNPSTGLINIEFAEETIDTKVDVMNSCGQVIISKDLGNHSFASLDISNHGKGMYFIKVQNGNRVVVRKVIVE